MRNLKHVSDSFMIDINEIKHGRLTDHEKNLYEIILSSESNVSNDIIYNMLNEHCLLMFIGYSRELLFNDNFFEPIYSINYNISRDEFRKILYCVMKTILDVNIRKVSAYKPKVK